MLDAFRAGIESGGLAIVRQLARMNGWNVELNARDGGGLEAWLTLPVQSGPAQDA